MIIMTRKRFEGMVQKEVNKQVEASREQIFIANRFERVERNVYELQEKVCRLEARPNEYPGRVDCNG